MLNRNIYFFAFLSLGLPAESLGQIGGSGTYSFLNLSSSARTASLGGTILSVKDSDINMAQQNPALLDSASDNHLVLNGVNYFADIQYGYAGFARHFKKAGTFLAGLQYVNYGTFSEADETGLITAEFGASEQVVNLSWAIPVDTLFSFGVAVKGIYSSLAEYNSTGIAVDLGGSYHDSKSGFSAGIVLRNMGHQLKPYREGNYESLPFEVAAGASKKLKKAPFRFSLTARQLQKFDITFRNPEKEMQLDPLTQLPVEQNFSFGEKVMRHMTLSTEAILSKNFHLRFGYNYQRRKELGLENKMSTTGFSWGFGMRISKLHISYGRATYHLAGGSNHFSISTDLKGWRKSKAL
jgi:hypothetical protein